MTFDFRIFSVMLALVALVIAPAAEAQNRLGNSELNVPATLIAETQQVKAGQSVTLAFVMEPKPTWHGYWENPGDAGIGMSFNWTLPAGVIAGKPKFQVPDTLLISGIMNYVYKGDYAVLVDLVLSDDVRPGPLPISVKSEWLSCTDEICVPEQDDLSITLQVAGKDAPLVLDKRFNGFRAALPRPLGSEASFAVTDNLFRLSVPLPASVEIDSPYFFILEDGVVDYAAPQKFTRDGDRLILETDARGDGFDAINGILKIGDHTGFLISAVKGDVAMTGLPLAGDDPKSESNGSLLFLALGGALLGGLLLNLMPCVFPILSLKAISLAKAGGSEAVVRRDALAYTAGVVLVATALGAVLLGLRASGAAVGWAFQLQDPRIIFVLLALVTAIGLNLAGLCDNRPAAGGCAGDLCRSRHRPGPALSAYRLCPGYTQPPAQARALAGQLPQDHGHPDVPHQHRPDLVARPPDWHRCARSVANLPAHGQPDPVVVRRGTDERSVPRRADQRGHGRCSSGRYHRPPGGRGDEQPEACALVRRDIAQRTV